MERRELAYFLSVAEHEGINGAAAALGVAQPTISQALRGLERELGVQLFVRVGRGMVLSAAGRSLVGPARKILRDITAVQDMLGALGGGLTGHLDISAFPALAPEVVPLVSEFRRAYPDVVVGFGEMVDESTATALIRDGHSEFVVAHLPIDDPRLEVVELGRQEYWLVYPPDTILPEGSIPLSDLPDIPMVFAPQGPSVVDEIQEAIRGAGVRLHNSVLVDHREARIPMVLAGLGGTIIERSQAEAVADRAVVRSVQPPITRSFGLAFDPATLSPVGQAFAELVRGRIVGGEPEN
ncbi:LysR family transcriptional regulator [Rhodococcus sp. NPDC003318]|uniref:LysR family transcriptional regulator n=1 Tax=Rhodococcus sp. NPDC003318 TaxID=3364503 RepID=UPI00369BF355